MVMVMAVFDQLCFLQSSLYTCYYIVLCQDNELSCLNNTCFVIMSLFTIKGAYSFYSSNNNIQYASLQSLINCALNNKS
jgi:hypothetical protein